MREGLLYSILLLFLISSCHKTSPGNVLPPPTKSGEHTLGFFVNDEAWIPYDRGSHERYELPKAKLEDDGSLKISATRIDDQLSCRHWFCIEIDEAFEGIGKYELSNVDCNSPYQTFYYGNNGDKPSEVYKIVAERPHLIEITYFDRNQKIISGSFEFEASSETNDTIKISSGRFDLHFE